MIVFLFQGAPDLILTKSCAVVHGENDGEDEVVEVNQQPSSMMSEVRVELCDGYQLAAVHMEKHQQSAKRLNRFLHSACRFLQFTRRLV